MNILITGANGFVGNSLVGALAKENNIIAIDKNIIKKKFSKEMIILNGDISNKNIIKKLSNFDIDVVYHLAAISSIPFSIGNPLLTFKVNVDGTQNLLEAARKNNIKRFIFISSSQVYGIPEYLPIDENHPINPNNPYATSKAIGELLVKEYSDIYGLKTTIIRPFSIYGPKQDSIYIIPSIINQALKNNKIILQNSKPIRDFLFINDLIELMILLYKNNNAIGEVYNLGYGKGISIAKLANTIKNLICPEKDIEFINKEERIGEIHMLESDIHKIKKLGWKPKVGIKEGLIKTIEYYEHQKSK